MTHHKKTIYELTRSESGRSKSERPIILVADNVRSMNNIGSFFRTADALGIHSILLCGISGCPPHPEIYKTALGAEDSVPWIYERDSADACRRLKEKGWTLCVLEQAHGSISPEDYTPAAGEKIALVVGNEVEGVKQKIVDMADIVLEIPQCGVKHSLNVSVSAGIALWSLVCK